MITDPLTAQVRAAIRRELDVRAWSLSELGRRANLDPSHLSKQMRGESSFHLTTLLKIGVAFGLEPRLRFTRRR